MARAVFIWNEHPTESAVAFPYARKVAGILKRRNDCRIVYAYDGNGRRPVEEVKKDAEALEKKGHDVIIMHKIPVSETNYGIVRNYIKGKKTEEETDTALRCVGLSTARAREISGEYGGNCWYNYHSMEEHLFEIERHHGATPREWFDDFYIQPTREGGRVVDIKAEFEVIPSRTKSSEWKRFIQLRERLGMRYILAKGYHYEKAKLRKNVLRKNAAVIANDVAQILKK